MKKYTDPMLEIVKIQVEDIVTTSGLDENEGDLDLT